MLSRGVPLAIACGLVALAACGGSQTADGPGGSPASGRLAKDATFTYGLAADPGSLDASANQSTGVMAMSAYAYDALVATVDGTRIVGNLATDWEVEPRRLRFTIRDGVTCSDGSPVTPSVIARSMRALNKPTSQITVFGALADWSVRGDDAAGTVTFRLGGPVGFPLESIADVPVVCGKGLRDRKLLRRGTSGSGPYVLEDAVSNDRYTFALRDDYAWGPEGVTARTPGLPARVVMRVVPDPATTANLLVNGELDAAIVTRTNADCVRSVGGVVSVENAVAQVAYNHDARRPTADVAVRRALTMAIDRETVMKVGHGKPVGNLVSPFSNPCRDLENAEAIPRYDPAAAAAALDEAGWRMGSDGTREKDGERLVIVAPVASSAAPEWQAGAELIVQAWRELGVDVRSRKLAGPAYVQELTEGEFDALPMFGAGDPTPAFFRAYNIGPPPPEGRNLLRLANREYERLSEEALGVTDRDKACPLWNEAERKLFEAADVVPLFASDVLYGHARNVELKVTTYGPVPTTIRVHED